MISSNIRMPLLIIGTVVFLALETIIASIYLLIYPGPSSVRLNLAFFLFGILVFVTVQLLIMLNINKELLSLSRHRRKDLKSIFIFIAIAQLALCMLLFGLLYQALMYLSYDTYLLLAIIFLTYVVAIVNLAFLSRQLIRWLNNNRSYVSIMFSISTFGILVNTILTVVFVSSVLLSQPKEIKLHFGILVPTITQSIVPLQIAYSTSFTVSYLLTWIASVMILHTYSKKIGRIRFWLLVTLPLLYMLGEFQSIILPLFQYYRVSDPVTFIISYSLFFSMMKLAGAIFFGIGLWIMAKKVEQKPLRTFLNLSAYGLMLVFVSNQSILLLNNLFPPIGLATVCFIGLSSFLLLVGTYSAAISVANDVRIRRSIRKSVQKELELLGNIGAAEMDIQLNKKIVSTMNALSTRIKEDTGIESSFTSDDIKAYTLEAIQEVLRNKNPK